MELVVDVEAGGETRRVEVGLDLAESSDLIRVVALCGIDALRRLSSGSWDNDAAKAILYVNLVRALSDEAPDWDNPPFAFEDVDLDWGELSEFMVELDPEMESTLAAASESLEEEE
ncbi:hypothetical protein LCGC14_2994380 [marine sediment metagenome]|uniref:Uncharacterized protein n=1 Tax=marine sediment metagenome TaxID=412755 RepID=A0A0F8ZAF8_9ZZZZ